MVDSPSFDVRCFGREREPVVVIENFASDPEQLRRLAAGAVFVGHDLYYPGIKANAPSDYFDGVTDIIATVMREVFGMKKGADVIRSVFSIVTTPPHLLTIEQRLPHVDSLEPGRMAILHYLAPEDKDGTAFYRHRSTGFETLDAERSGTYFAALNADLRLNGPPSPSYISGDTLVFEQIGSVEGAYNRALIYRGRVLHSGAIAAGRELPSDPLRGRLTIASFLAAE